MPELDVKVKPKDITAFYHKDEVYKETILGIDFEIETMPGLEYIDLNSKYMILSEGRIDRRGYTKELIERCVRSPKFEVSKLDSPMLVVLMVRIEFLHGGAIGEIAKK
jgi:hypothetical protein